MKPSGAECQCVKCDLVFTAISAFDRHRRDGQCIPPDKTKPPLFGYKRRGGVVWGGAPGKRGRSFPREVRKPTVALVALSVLIWSLWVTPAGAQSCVTETGSSIRFVRGNPPSQWFPLPNGDRLEITGSLSDIEGHPQQGPQTGERISVEFDNETQTHISPDLPDDAISIDIHLGTLPRDGATQWRIVHHPDDANITADSVEAEVTVRACPLADSGLPDLWVWVLAGGAMVLAGVGVTRFKVESDV